MDEFLLRRYHEVADLGVDVELLVDLLSSTDTVCIFKRLVKMIQSEHSKITVRIPNFIAQSLSAQHFTNFPYSGETNFIDVDVRKVGDINRFCKSTGSIIDFCLFLRDSFSSLSIYAKDLVNFHTQANTDNVAILRKGYHAFPKFEEDILNNNDSMQSRFDSLIVLDAYSFDVNQLKELIQNELEFFNSLDKVEIQHSCFNKMGTQIDDASINFIRTLFGLPLKNLVVKMTSWHMQKECSAEISEGISCIVTSSGDYVMMHATDII